MERLSAWISRLLSGDKVIHKTLAIRSVDMKKNTSTSEDRLLIKQALVASELRYRRLFESAKDGILILDAETGMVVDVNPFLIELLGLSHEAFLGRKIWELGIFKDIAANEAKFAELQTQEYVRYEDLPLETADGRQIAVEFVSNVYLAGGHKVIQCNIRDNTEHKKAAEALRVSEELTKGILNAIPVRVFWKDRNLAYLGCNAVFARDAGFAEPKDIIGKDDYQMGWRDQAELYRRDDRQVIESGCPKLLSEEPQTTPEGKTLTLLTTKMPLRNSNGEICGVLGTYFDITTRKQMEESHVRLAKAVEQAAETIVITDTQGTILYTNPAFEKTSGYTCEETLGLNPRVLKSGRHDAEFYWQLWDTLQRGEVWHGNFVNKRKDGSLYEEEATISPVRDAADTIINYVAVKRDVTHEVEIENQLRQSQKMECIGQLAGGVAHDFNNILAVISLQTSLLGDAMNHSRDQTELLAEIARTVQSGADLTRQLLIFSQRQTLRLRNLDLNDSVINLGKMLQRILGEDIRMEFKFSPHPLYVHADAGMMDQILMNLTVNARHAMPEGGHLIIETSDAEFDELSAAQATESRPGLFACLSVSDTGCGIAPENLERIFEPFFTTKGVGKGTGLGLATVFGIVKQHKGWINVYSEIGHGTTFRVYLPRLIGSKENVSARPMQTTVVGGNETILVVEDNLDLLVLMDSVLSHLGYRVLKAPTGVAALELWRQNRNEIKLLLTDLVMPGGMNGRELAKQLLEESPGLKVIYASGYSAEIADNDLYLEEGVNFLSKPFRADKLAHAVRARLDYGTLGC